MNKKVTPENYLNKKPLNLKKKTREINRVIWKMLRLKICQLEKKHKNKIPRYKVGKNIIIVDRENLFY